MTWHARRHHRARSEHGAAAVEFGLVLLPLMTLLLGLMQYGWYFYVNQSASAAAREGARQVIVGECWDNLLSFTQAQSPMVGTATIVPDVSSDTVTVGDMVTVTVTVPATASDIIGFLPMPGDGSIEESFSARLEDKEPGGSC